MMEVFIILLLLAIAVVAYLVVYQGKQHAGNTYETQERSSMPHDLARGKLLLSEYTLRIEHPAALVAKVDQVFIGDAGQLILMETKTRNRAVVYSPDIIELSVQAMCIRHSTDAKVKGLRLATHAYVRIKTLRHKPTFIRVDLLSDQQVVNLYHRYLALQENKVKPSLAVDDRVCKSCPQIIRCPKMASR